MRTDILKEVKNVLLDKGGPLALERFKEGVVGRLIDIKRNHSASNALHHLLARQLKGSDIPCDESWFQVGGQTIRFRPTEYALVTGLHFGNSDFDPYAKHKPPRNGIFNRFFNGVSTKVHVLRKRFNEKSLGKDVEDYLKAANLLVYYLFLLCRDNPVIEDWAWTLVEDFERWDAFPWGSYTYGALSYYIDTVGIAPDQAEKDYHFYGPVWALQIWSYEAVPDLGSQCGFREREEILPRCLRWSTRQMRKIDFATFLEKRRPVYPVLEATSSELDEYYMMSFDNGDMFDVRFEAPVRVASRYETTLKAPVQKARRGTKRPRQSTPLLTPTEGGERARVCCVHGRPCPDNEGGTDRGHDIEDRLRAVIDDRLRAVLTDDSDTGFLAVLRAVIDDRLRAVSGRRRSRSPPLFREEDVISHHSQSRSRQPQPQHVAADEAFSLQPQHVPTEVGTSLQPQHAPTEEAIVFQPQDIPIEEVTAFQPQHIPTETSASWEPQHVPNEAGTPLQPQHAPADEAIVFQPQDIPIEEVTAFQPQHIPTETSASWEPQHVPNEAGTPLQPQHAPADEATALQQFTNLFKSVVPVSHSPIKGASYQTYIPYDKVCTLHSPDKAKKASKPHDKVQTSEPSVDLDDLEEFGEDEDEDTGDKSLGPRERRPSAAIRTPFKGQSPSTAEVLRTQYRKFRISGPNSIAVVTATEAPLNQEFFDDLENTDMDFTQDVIDQYVLFIRTRLGIAKEKNMSTTLVIGTDFYVVLHAELTRLHPKDPNFKKVKGKPTYPKWTLPEGLERLVKGLDTTNSTPWWNVDFIVAICLVGKNHWVTVRIRLVDWKVELYDSLSHLFDEGKASVRDDEMKPITRLMPRLLELSGYWENTTRIKREDEMELRKMPSSAQFAQVDNHSCGPFACMYLDRLVATPDKKLRHSEQINEKYIKKYRWIVGSRIFCLTQI
ncbi:uncharacterized protein LOC130997975 [Salvia miltiorrhiza]|uniref:uncharacterized protein LOC130997975 n=2 Tax=Salvia miltiorrhiza TaxID=226208 RepID=UPI0025ACB51D|nr:uncharacterized protein LOC130997975 [Salvia miltiorrhiza]